MTTGGDPPRQLVLQGVLPELARIPVWIESFAPRYAISGDIQLAINLCLEEAVSNVIRHGYCGEAGRSVTVLFSNPRENYFVFTVEDNALHFDPLLAPELPELSPREHIRIGGQGIRFLRRFTDTLEYEQLPNGNRLHMGFAAVSAKTRTKS